MELLRQALIMWTVDQPEYRARFGDEQFVTGDGCDLDLLRQRVRETGAFAIGAGPPCKPYSTGRKGEPMQPAFIAQTRDVLARIVRKSQKCQVLYPSNLHWRFRYNNI